MKDATPQALEFVSRCLSKNPANRPTVAELLEFPWIKALQNQQELTMRRQIEIGANILQFAKASTAQAWVCSMIANLLTKAEDLREVRAAFVKWDTRKDGVLTSDEISEHMADICSYF